MPKQCAKCPWRKDVNPHDIPDGYCETKHLKLKETIAEPGVLPKFGESLRIMACHESKPRKMIPCKGWLANQHGPGNNLGLRLAVISGRISMNFELVGEQHQRFEDTLPKE